MDRQAKLHFGEENMPVYEQGDASCGLHRMQPQHRVSGRSLSKALYPRCSNRHYGM